MKTDKPKHRFLWLKILISIFVLFFATILYAQYIGPTGISIIEQNIIDNRIPSSFYGYKIAHLSDIHYNSTVDKKSMEKIIKKLNKSKTDIVVITGDLLDKDITYTDEDVRDITELLNAIEGKYKYIITGDHDYNDKFKEIISKSSFTLLDNNYVTIYNNDYDCLLIGGLSSKADKISYDEKIANIEQAIENNQVAYSILLIHEPSITEKIKYRNFQLILAGHTHNGQINIPGLKQLFMPPGDNHYVNLSYNLNNTKLKISGGIGTTKMHARLFNRPSINLYRLLNK